MQIQLFWNKKIVYNVQYVFEVLSFLYKIGQYFLDMQYMNMVLQENTFFDIIPWKNLEIRSLKDNNDLKRRYSFTTNKIIIKNNSTDC